MTILLPDPISTYFSACNGADPARLARCFTRDASVKDDGQAHLGHDAIEAWQRESRQKYEFSIEPLSVAQDGDRVTVATNVVGNFPGSPIQLDHVFLLAGDKIQSLEIH
ncbi:nuclear transport factor 2 family protein [Microbulbifer hainanensis]|uniref:nuclear transport factor 2 family protein n=1 Tax=Microbulbifer TaxID=48073 RepID=UPI001865FD7D|nr:nuclear transport factor 2 family protein [Microbulbifer hainanensis]